jgi:ectoine hydroxylase
MMRTLTHTEDLPILSVKPLVLKPGKGQHREGLIAAEVNPDGQVEQAARYRYDISRQTMRFGVEAVMGPRGSVLFMDANLVHGSTVNMTPLRRAILYINITDNRGTLDRTEYQAARDFSPLQSLDDDCLMKWSDPG